MFSKLRRPTVQLLPLDTESLALTAHTELVALLGAISSHSGAIRQPSNESDPGQLVFFCIEKAAERALMGQSWGRADLEDTHEDAYFKTALKVDADEVIGWFDDEPLRRMAVYDAGQAAIGLFQKQSVGFFKFARPGTGNCVYSVGLGITMQDGSAIGCDTNY